MPLDLFRQLSQGVVHKKPHDQRFFGILDIMKFAIITDVHMGEEVEFKGVNRKLSRYSLSSVQEFVSTMNEVEKPEFVVNLGDMIEDSDYETDVANIKTVLGELEKLACPVLNLVGNHEQWAIDEKGLQDLLGVESLFYSKDICDWHMIVMFSEAFGGEDSHIREEQISWLQKNLEDTDKPTLVFIHHSLADQDLTGNFWFEGKENRALVGNRQAVRSVMEDSEKVKAVFNGHVHWNRMDEHGGIPYFTINSIVENVKNDGVPSGCYALVELTESRIVVDIKGIDTAHFEHTL